MTPQQRELRKTVFAFGEGETESILLKHLRSIYAQGKTHATIDHAGGKDITYIIEKATRVRSYNEYDFSFILLDTVPKWPATATAAATKKGFVLIGSTPCIEATLLKMLDPAANFSGYNSNRYKKKFTTNHLNGRSLISESECRRLFLKARIDAARKVLPDLERIISIFEGKF